MRVDRHEFMDGRIEVSQRTSTASGNGVRVRIESHSTASADTLAAESTSMGLNANQRHSEITGPRPSQYRDAVEVREGHERGLFESRLEQARSSRSSTYTRRRAEIGLRNGLAKMAAELARLEVRCRGIPKAIVDEEKTVAMAP